jgi:hypothetical protein
LSSLFSSLDEIGFPFKSRLNWFRLADGLSLGSRRLASPMQQAENRGNKKQGGHCGAQQAANDGAPERRILLATVT